MVNIVTQGNPVLREIAPEVPQSMFGSDELKKIIADMSEALRATRHGVAIAAPQIGVSLRIFVVSGFVVSGNERNHDDPDVVFINPKLKKVSRKKEEMDEGCLSVPEMYGKTVRATQASVVAYDVDGNKFERGGSGLLAQIFQHECDHLNGVLFVDHARDVEKHVPRTPEETHESR